MSLYYLHLYINTSLMIAATLNIKKQIFNKRRQDGKVQWKIKSLKILKQANQIKIKAFKQRILF